MSSAAYEWNFAAQMISIQKGDSENIYSKKLKVVLDKLNNKAFIDKAPDNVIENFKIQEKEINSSIEKIDEIINTIN